MNTNSPTTPLPRATEPSLAGWWNKTTYKEVLLDDYLSPLDEAARNSGRVPQDLQRTVIEKLHWYFTIDQREQAPTAIVSESMAEEFHDIVARIMHHVEIDTIASIESSAMVAEVKHALLSYKNVRCHSPISINAIDHDQRLVRITYFLHGDKPSEVFLLDNCETTPAFAKYRACNYFRRMLLRQRIVWLPFTQEKNIEVFLDGKLTEITLGKQNLVADVAVLSSSGNELLTEARSVFPPGRGGRQPLPFNLSGLKARLLRGLAQLLPVRKRFENAWVFADREDEADDSAEHLYRWIKNNHPEINAWFLLDKKSPDWTRLAAEGFRLIAPGLQSKLLLVNTDHIVSSHTELLYGALKPELYGDLMKWRYTFPQHGVIKDDLSHYLSNKPIDLFITSSPDEHESIIANDSPYTYTEREVRRTGLPRHDGLLAHARQLAPAEVDTLLVMPTWRSGLVNAKNLADSKNDILRAFAESEYAKSWGSFLRTTELHELLLKHDKKLFFLLHPRAAQFIDAFALPSSIESAIPATVDFQRLLSRSVALVTDYTSVAFSFALLRRTVFHFQFDRESFFGGNHTGREGYFNYERDGFGPVSLNQDDLLMQIRVFLENGARPEPEYLARMEHAMPDVDGRSCERVFEEIVNIRKPYVH